MRLLTNQGSSLPPEGRPFSGAEKEVTQELLKSLGCSASQVGLRSGTGNPKAWIILQ